MIFSSGTEEARHYIDMGFDAVANSIDTVVFMQAFKSMVDGIRDGGRSPA